MTSSDSLPIPESCIIVGFGGVGVDILAAVPSFPRPDAKIRSTDLKVQGGGNTGNALTCAARLGLKPRIISKIANDSQGRALLEELEVDGVDTSFVVVSKEGTTPFSYIIVDNQTKTRTCIHTAGYPPMIPEDLPRTRLLSALNGARLAYFDVRMPETALVIAHEAFSQNIPIFVDAERPREGLDDLLKMADYVVCPEKFPQAWTEESSIPRALVSIMLRLPRLKFVIATLGKDGCIMLEQCVDESSLLEEMDIDSTFESLTRGNEDSIAMPTCIASEAFEGGELDPTIFETLLVLIPKVDHPTKIKEFRPISLCNVLYKIVTKVLVHRIRPYLGELVGPLQGGFIPGRVNTDNLIVAKEVLHHMHKMKTKKGVLAFKTDLEKTYNRVDWAFLEKTLQEFDFPLVIISLIMSCVRSSSSSVLWNGNRLDSFKPARGLWQGDPMSPILFILCMEKLAGLINLKVEEGDWKPIAISRGGPAISHLLFADDVLLFCKAKKKQVQLIMEVLDDFCKASGMKVNFEKSKVMCSKNVTRTRRDLFTSISSVCFTSDIGKYLGVPLTQGRINRSHFQDILSQITGRLASWKGRILNRAGRLCLAKSVLVSLLVYRMQVEFFSEGSYR